MATQIERRENDVHTAAPALPPSGSLSLELPDGTSFDDWQRIGRELAAREKVLNWWIGDWWAFGEHRYGERAKAAAEGLFPLSMQSLMHYGSVSRAFDPTCRRLQVPFSAHQETAPLVRQNPDAAQTLLDRAERENMTVAQVRSAVRAIQGKTQSEVLSAREEDPIYYQTLTIGRDWNRSYVEARQAHFGLMTAHMDREFVEAFIEAGGDELWGDVDP